MWSGTRGIGAVIGVVVVVAACGDGRMTVTDAKGFDAARDASAIDAASVDAPGSTIDATPAPNDGARPDSAVCRDVVGEVSRHVLAGSVDGVRGLALAPVAGPPIVAGREPLTSWTTLTPTVALIERLNGVDVTVTYRNDGSAPAALGRIHLTGIELERVIRLLDLRHGTAWVDVAPPPGSIGGYHSALRYPFDNYSPVQVLSDGALHVGFSLLYPIMDYEQHVLIEVLSEPSARGDDRRSYAVQFVLEGHPLPAGATRTFTVAVRAVPAAVSWLETLLPYRNYFRSLYGGVRYERDPRPVIGHGAASDVAPDCATDNPFSYGPHRPDRNGWAPWSEILRGVPALGFERVMFWAPSGLFCAHPELNYPTEFLSKMLESPPMAASLDALRAIPSAGIDMGYWWGHSAAVIPTWDGSEIRVLDPTSSEDRARAFRELDLARDLGATTIGLDAFAFESSAGRALFDDWVAYEWLQELQSRAPGVRFVTENLTSDFVHTLAPSFTTFHETTGPHTVADLLLPGHETWGYIRYDVAFAGDPNWYYRPLPERLAIIEATAARGFVPVVAHGETAVSAAHRAAPSWESTVPVHLRGPCD